MTLTTAKAEVVMRDITAKFDNSVRAATPFYPRVCTVMPSNGRDEKYDFLGNMPGVREWKGDRKFQQLRAASFEIENKHWESSLLVSKNDIKDDRLGMYGPLTEDLAAEATHHPDELWFDTLIAGTSTACFDGQYFFDTDHSWGDSGSQSNDLTSTVVSNVAVTVAEFKTAYHAARSAMLNFKRDNGKFFRRPVVMGMSNLMLIVPTELEEVATTAVTATLVGGGDTNVIIDKPKIVTSPYLTTATSFYLLNLGDSLKPFVFQAREPLSRSYKGMDDLETKDIKFMTEARYNLGYLAWWNAVYTAFVDA